MIILYLRAQFSVEWHINILIFSIGCLFLLNVIHCKKLVPTDSINNLFNTHIHIEESRVKKDTIKFKF